MQGVFRPLTTHHSTTHQLLRPLTTHHSTTHQLHAHDHLTLARYNRAFCLARLRRRDEALGILDALLVEDEDNALAFTLRELLLSSEKPDDD